MRDYSKVTPRFWIGKTGRALRGHPEAQIVAAYLITSPHANMIGMYHLPIAYIANDTGLSLEGATKGLQRALEAGIGAYDFDAEVVWIFKMAEYQIDIALSPNDNRVKGIEREYANVPENKYLSAFYDMYSGPFCMSNPRGEASPLQAPYKPLRSQEQEQEQEQEQKHEQEKEHDAPASQKNKIISGVAAWGLLVRALSGDSDEWNNAKTPAMIHAVKTIGGSSYLGSLDTKQIAYLKSDFMHAYNAVKGKM